MQPDDPDAIEEVRVAVEHVVEDLRNRSVWLSDDTEPTVMAWFDAHRHHATAPYIGCPFCREKFVLKGCRSEQCEGPQDMTPMIRAQQCLKCEASINHGRYWTNSDGTVVCGDCFMDWILGDAPEVDWIR